MVARSLTGAQIRAARALLKWSAADLARHCALGVNTIRRAEIAEDATSLTIANELAIRRTLEFGRRRIHRRERRRSGGATPEANIVAGQLTTKSRLVLNLEI